MDKSYTDIQHIWNNVNDDVLKKYPNLKNTNGGTGFTNGGRELYIKFNNYNYSKKTVDINGKTVDFDNLINYVFGLLKKEGLV